MTGNAADLFDDQKNRVVVAIHPNFADALHIASSAHAERFVTFDAKLVKRAKRVSKLEVAVV